MGLRQIKHENMLKYMKGRKIRKSQFYHEEWETVKELISSGQLEVVNEGSDSIVRIRKV